MNPRSPAAPWPVVAGLAVCLAYAAAALASGAERLSTVAAPRAAAAALVGGEAAALPLAAQAVRADPLNEHTVGVLGAAALLAGGADHAARVFAQGRRLGWRDVPTRSFSFEQDARAGRWAEAGRHLEAVLRAHPDLPVTGEMLARLEQQPGGRLTLTRLLQRNPDWTARHFAAPETSDAALAIRAAWLTRERTGALGCPSAQPLVERLLERGMRRAAGWVWQAHCDARALPLVADARFSGLASGRSAWPFGWQVHPTGDATISSKLASMFP